MKLGDSSTSVPSLFVGNLLVGGFRPVFQNKPAALVEAVSMAFPHEFRGFLGFGAGSHQRLSARSGLVADPRSSKRSPVMFPSSSWRLIFTPGGEISHQEIHDAS